ncbi:hypothetical protein NN561_001311 [Cricetulus griseus]
MGPSKPQEARGRLSPRRSTHEAWKGGRALREPRLRLREAVSSSPKAARPPRAGTPLPARPRPPVVPNARDPRGRGGESAIRNPRSASGPRRPSLASLPGDPPSTRGGAPRRRSPGRAPAGTQLQPLRDGLPAARGGSARDTLGRALAPPRSRPRQGLPEPPLVPQPFESSPALVIGRAPWRVRCARSGASGVPTRLISAAQTPRRAPGPAPSRGVPRAGGGCGPGAAVWEEDEAHPAAEPKRPVLSRRSKGTALARCPAGSDWKWSPAEARGRRAPNFPPSPLLLSLRGCLCPSSRAESPSS